MCRSSTRDLDASDGNPKVITGAEILVNGQLIEAR
jgi:hypothetical protein